MAGRFFLTGKQLFFLVVMFCLSNISFSQGENKTLLPQYNEEKKLLRKYSYFDSVETFSHGKKALELIRQMNLPYLEAEVKLHYANYFFFQTDYKTAEKYYSEAEEIATRFSNDTLRNIIRVKFAFIQHELGNWTESTRIYEEVTADAESTKDTSALIEALNGFANLKEIQNKNEEALALYNRALNIAGKSEKKYQFAYLLNNRALLKMKLNFFDAAKKDLLEAIILSRQDRLTQNLLNNIGLIYLGEHKNDSATLYFEKFYSMAKKNGVPEGLVVGLLNISQLKALKGNIDEAIKLCDTALKITEEHKMIFHKAKILNALSQHHIQKKDFKTAILFANKSLGASKITGSLEDISGSWNLLSQSYRELKDFKNAYECDTLYKFFSDSLNSLSSKKRFSELQVQYEVEQKEKTIEEGKSKLMFLQKEQIMEKSRNRLIILLLSGVGIIIIGILYIRYIRIRKKQQELFSQKLIEGIEEERSRIAKELHDDIGANLSLVKNKIYINSEKGDKELFSQLNSDVSNVIEQTRGISHQLYPSYLYKLGLPEAIQHFLHRVERDTGITVNEKIQPDIEKYVSESTKLHIFRIIQELANNTIKHAHASTIDIDLRREENSKIFLNYSDNGDGLKNNKSDGMGMISIKERVKILNGKMKIEPENEKGFKISFIFSTED